MKRQGKRKNNVGNLQGTCQTGPKWQPVKVRHAAGQLLLAAILACDVEETE